MSSLQFGDRVLVLARIVPVVGSINGNGMHFRQAIPPRDHGRVVAESLEEATTWPGGPVPLSWVPGPARFVLEPDGGPDAYRRLRRIVATVPTIGVVVGTTYKKEGTLRPGASTADLGGPARLIDLYEVAVPSKSRAQLVLAHPLDLQNLVSTTGG